jgi:hypothetical protein
VIYGMALGLALGYGLIVTGFSVLLGVFVGEQSVDYRYDRLLTGAAVRSGAYAGEGISAAQPARAFTSSA